MADTLEDRLAKLKARTQELERERTRAEAWNEQVTQQREALMAELKKMGFDSVEDAEKKVEELQSKVSEVLDKAESLLA